MSRPNGAATARPASSSATSFERAGPPAAPLDAARRGVVARRTNRPHHHAGVGVGDFVRDHRVVARLHVHGDVGTASARRAHARYRVGEVDDADGHHDATVEGSGRVRPAVGPAGWHVRHEGIDGTDAVLGTRCSSSATRVAADGVEVLVQPDVHDPRRRRATHGGPPFDCPRVRRGARTGGGVAQLAAMGRYRCR